MRTCRIFFSIVGIYAVVIDPDKVFYNDEIQPDAQKCPVSCEIV